jgi:hypothetical protein
MKTICLSTFDPTFEIQDIRQVAPLLVTCIENDGPTDRRADSFAYQKIREPFSQWISREVASMASVSRYTQYN